MDQKVCLRAMAWADSFGFPGSQGRPKPWLGHDFGLAWPQEATPSDHMDPFFDITSFNTDFNTFNFSQIDSTAIAQGPLDGM